MAGRIGRLLLPRAYRSSVLLLTARLSSSEAYVPDKPPVEGEMTRVDYESMSCTYGQGMCARARPDDSCSLVVGERYREFQLWCIHDTLYTKRPGLGLDVASRLTSSCTTRAPFISVFRAGPAPSQRACAQKDTHTVQHVQLCTCT